MADTHLPCFTRAVEKPIVPYKRCGSPTATIVSGDERERDGSIIVVVATDAPLLPHQLKRLAKRPSLGLGRLGSIAANGSGDIFIAFSTANPELRSVGGNAAPLPVSMLANDRLSPLFEAVAQATEEAVVNAMVTATTMEGADGLRVYGLPHERLRQILARYNRLNGPR